MTITDNITNEPSKPVPPDTKQFRWLAEGELTCNGPECNKPIPAGWYHRNKKVYYCCGKCQHNRLMVNRNRWVRCTGCGKRFLHHHTGKDRPFCSKACFSAWRMQRVNKSVGRFRPIFDSFLENYHPKHFSAASIYEHRTNAGAFLAFLVRKRIRSLNSVKPSHISQFLAEKSERRPRGLANVVSSIRALFEWAILTGKRKGGTPLLAIAHRGRDARRLPRPYKPQELALIWI